MKHSKPIVLAVALLIAAGAWSWSVHRTSAARDRVQQHIAELEAEREALDHRREALWGETRDGAAWPHYAAALARLESEEGDTVRRIQRASRPDDGPVVHGSSAGGWCC